MAKLTELNGWDLMSALAELAEPVGNLVNDDDVWNCFKRCTKKGVSLKPENGFRFLLKTYAELFPMLCGERHKMDTLKIIAIAEGKTIKEVMSKNGAEILRDFEKAYREVLEPFFIKSARSERTE